MTVKEKLLVGELCQYAMAVCHGHDVKEILREKVLKVKPLLAK